MADTRCPHCGSDKIRNSYITSTAAFTGKLAAKLTVGVLTLPFGSHINRMISGAAGSAGAEVGKFLWNKMVCENCGHSWDVTE